MQAGDIVILVTPIDAAAPKGRLILPQQQVLRDLLDHGMIAVVTRETELAETLSHVKPALVVTDSQAFGYVKEIVPQEMLLTSFSVLFARYKGQLETAKAAAGCIDRLKDGDHVLISEGCSHHRQCGDIGTQKLPAWLKKHTGKELAFTWTSGTEFAQDLTKYALVIHCGGCMLNEREMQYRKEACLQAGVPMTNYGMAIAHMNGILKRSLAVFQTPVKRGEKE